DDLVYDFTIQNTDSFVEQDFKKFLEINNRYVFTNEKLDDEQIVEIILEQNEQEQGDPDDTDKESVQVSILEGLNGLKTFIAFFKQQMNVADFYTNDLRIFRRYLHTMELKNNKSKKQKSIRDFFTSENSYYSISDYSGE
ncbi:14613_t:CDS:1, partial [Racocetra fulgida]